MELSSCVVFVLLILIPVNRATAFVLINSTSQARTLFKNSSALSNGTIRLNQVNKECDCGVSSYGCHLVNGKKICNCDMWTAQDGDVCKYCNCGIFSTRCYFQNGKRFCDCLPGSSVSQENCRECNCGLHSTNCAFEGYDKVCTCENGYIQIYGKCEACDCGENSISCSLTYGGVRKCKCRQGYVAEETSYYNDDEKCVFYSPSSGWRIATYIEGIFFSIIIIGLFIFICSKKAAI